MTRPMLSAVVPCFNEASGLVALYKRLVGACSRAVGDDFEIILVNDGSTDRSFDVIRTLAAQDSRVIGVDLSRNFGHQLAVSAGLARANGATVLVIDADLQDPPELLPDMLRALAEGADVAYGVRVERQGESWFKRASAALFYRFISLMSDVPIPLDSGDFRLMTRRVVDLLNAMPEQGRYLRGMSAWTGFRQVGVPYVRAPRHAGESSYPLHRMMVFSLEAITAFSVRPLRLGGLLGAGASLFGLAVFAYALQSWARGQAVAGWTSVMAAVLLLGSAQLFVLGVIGEYLGRLVVQSKGRPLYVVRAVVRGATATTCDLEPVELEAATLRIAASEL